MSEQDNGQVPTLQRPTTDDQEDWKAYWEQQGQPWRTEPEIDMKRQGELAQRRAIVPDTVKGIYPFKEVRLSRADVEWLLATHENGRGPVDWSDDSQRGRNGLDVRGADLHEEDLSNLPLANIEGGLDSFAFTNEECNMAAVLMQGANFRGAQMQGAILDGAQLREANFDRAQLQKVNLVSAHLKEANFAHSQLQRARLRSAHLKEANFWWADLQEADFSQAQLQKSVLIGARLQKANLFMARLHKANLGGAQLQGAILKGTQLQGANLISITLADESLGSPELVDAELEGINLSVVDWSQVKLLGDEYRARQKKQDGKVKDKRTRWSEHWNAVRANRQLAVALQSQGLNEDAARFAYRAQLMQRKLFWSQRQFGQYLFSLLIDLLAGYGFKPWRSFAAYLIVIAAFATAYFIIGHTVGPSLSPLSSVVFSMTSFHGRGFFPGGIGLDDPLTVVAAFEAFVGLLIEVTFIATLTQRLFGK